MNTPPKPYSEAYLSEVVEMQGKFFERLQDEPTPIDSADMITAYLNSDTRRQLDEGHAYYLTLSADDLKRVFLEESHYEPKPGKPLRGFLPNWIGQFYAYAQWKLGVSSRELVRRIPVKVLGVAYPGLHDLPLPLAVDKMTNTLPDPSLRKGSALLIVLGILAFMVMSAVSFSIYMRQNRLPSSFLTQQASASFVVKAALAEAMHELDHALGDDPYPNDYDKNRDQPWLFGGCSYSYGSSALILDGSPQPQPHKYAKCCLDADGHERAFYNAWRNRVYIGDPAVAEQGVCEACDGAGCDERTTSATLPFEGLAYLPPPLVNTVRYWMRHSPSAQWRRLPYDAGRWCFTAVNVSDYLDINRLKANTLRDSSATNRINLAYRFEDANHTGWGAATPATFDQKIDALRADANLGRLTSMADYNLAIGKGQLNGLGYASLFCKYIKNTSLKVYYEDADIEPAAQQTFVTDSWYPSTNETVAAGAKHTVPIVLSEWANDPFLPGYTGPNFPSVLTGNPNPQATLDDLQLTAAAGSPLETIQKRLNLATLAALADYIDEDGVPASLAVPTAEHTPMLTGLQIDFNKFKPEFSCSKQTPIKSYGGNPNQQATPCYWNLTAMDGNVQVTGTAVFPFKRTSGRDARTYTVEVLLKCGFAEKGKFNTVRIVGDQRPYANPNWSTAATTSWDKDGFFTLYGSKPLSVKSNVQKPIDALIDFNMTLRVQGIPPGTLPIYAYDYVEDNTTGTWMPLTPPNDKVANTSLMSKPFSYLDENGIAQVSPTKGSSLVLHFVCLAWARIVDQDGNTVDLFPARTGPVVAPSKLDDDDKLLNGIDNIGRSPAGKTFTDLCGSDYPVVPILSVDPVLTLDDAFFPYDKPAAVTPAEGSLALYCNDPRYNFAPEDWYAVNVSGGVKASDWLSRVKAVKGDDDIFQFVSDAGCLQSMGEMQFLPWTGEFGNGGAAFKPVRGIYFSSSKYDGKSWADAGRTSPGALANAQFMWKSYWAFGSDRDPNGNDMYNWGIVDTDGGVSVPRYASDLNLFMAAIANTPYDWTVADPANGYTATDTEKLCFNEWSSSEANVKWADLQKIAAKMQENFLGGVAYEKWIDWDDANFFGVLGSNEGIHDVDRKFLFSYWRNCFEENQQLFLLFIRAEPLMMMGGGEQSYTPAQLGARSVALVWRDPRPHPKAGTERVVPNRPAPENHPPHRMRVLFYHQFD